MAARHRNVKIKIPAYTRNDVWVFLGIVPLQVIVCNRIILGEEYFSSLKIFAGATLFYLVYMFLVFQLCGIFAIRFLKAMPDVKDIPKRLILSVLTYMAITVASITPLLWIYDKVPMLHYTMTTWTNVNVALVCILGNIIVTIIFEGLSAFERWKVTLFETEQLKKENLRTQLQSLKNQINPHFLFNSINSLSSLIAEDPDKAEVFLDEMSKVYRYLLRNNEDNLIPLQLELQFISSYYHLLKTRYGEGIEMNVDVDEKFKDYQIPPLTLQILVENAVKHNIILKEQPLRIDILCHNPHEIIVRNNLQRKQVKVISHRVGLENISAKYQLMNQPDIVINEENDMFIVTIPLIENIIHQENE